MSSEGILYVCCAGVVLVVAGIIGALMAYPWKQCQKVYWDEEEQQIKTRDGKCRYDKVAIDGIAKKLGCTTDRTLKDQLKCSAKGHGEWVYQEYVGAKCSPFIYVSWFRDKATEPAYLFKCSNCGLEITKTKKELTPSEREALKKLKLLEK